MWNALKAAGVEVRIRTEADDLPVRGNACVSGDDDFDKKVEDKIIASLDAGDVWAWASVQVSVCYMGFEESDYLGCCCYSDEEDFVRSGDYFEGMRDEAFRRLLEKLDTANLARNNLLAICQKGEP